MSIHPESDSLSDFSDLTDIDSDDSEGAQVFAADIEGQEPQCADDEQTLSFRDLSFEALRTDDPLDALPYFWQPSKETNHRLILPLHTQASNLKENCIKLSFYLDFLLVIGAEIGLDTILIDPETRGL